MARISVLRRGTTRKTRLDHRLIRQSERFALDPYFGSKPDVRVRPADPGQEGQLDRAHRPTWAPFLANPIARENWWRSSRPK